MARRNNNHWLDNIINYNLFPVPRTRRARIVRTDNPTIVVGNGILDQINPHYISWHEEETTAPM